MGWTVGIPSLKLNMIGTKSKHCGGFYAVAAEALEERLGHDPDINRALAEKNVYMGYQTAEELIAYSCEHCAELKDAKGRSLRADAVRMCATIIKPPAAYMATLSEEDQRRFLDDGIEKLKEIVGADNVKSIAIHFDEQGAHAHVFWEPMTKDGRLCAKEMHNLKFFSRLNKEMPEHLRACGWDIDDCNAYDQAKETLCSEQEKAERRQKNGRSSAVFKAEAERKLNEINLQIDCEIERLEERFDAQLRQKVQNMLNDSSGKYDNALFLMAECSDERFEDLDREGRELKEERLEQIAGVCSPADGLDKLIAEINAGKLKTVSWEERNQMWETYRNVSNLFWAIREDLSRDYQEALDDAYNRRRDVMRSYYDAMYYLRRSRSFLSIFGVIALFCITSIREKQVNKQIEVLRAERHELIKNTASFKRFSNAYREDLKAGRMPFARDLNSMAVVVRTMDADAEEFRKRPMIRSENRAYR